MEDRWTYDGVSTKKKRVVSDGYGGEWGFMLKKIAKHLHIADSFCNFAANFHSYRYII